MSLLMKRCLVLISVLLWVVTCYSQALDVSSQSQKYTISITLSRAGITGICVLRDNGGQVVGSVVNEFGIKAFDFVYDKKKDKTKLKNVIKMLDKWYIKKVIAADFSVLIRKHNKSRHLRKRNLCCDGGKVKLENRKYDIIYKFESIDHVER